MADDNKEVKKTIRKMTACATTTRFITLLRSTKKVRMAAAPQLATATHVAAPKMNATKDKEKKPASAWTPFAWVEQADGYKATKRAFSGFNKEEHKKGGSLVTKHDFTGSIFKEGLSRKYCAAFNTIGCFCELGAGCDKNHDPFFSLFFLLA